MTVPSPHTSALKSSYMHLRNRIPISENGERFFSSPKCPDWLWGLASILFNEYVWLLP
jgi:hypothetical protein